MGLNIHAETVLVVLGRTGDPATITTWPNTKRRPKRQQYIGHSERLAMGKDQTAIFQAELLDGVWRLKRRLSKPEIEPVYIPEEDLPF